MCKWEVANLGQESNWDDCLVISTNSKSMDVLNKVRRCAQDGFKPTTQILCIKIYGPEEMDLRCEHPRFGDQGARLQIRPPFHEMRNALLCQFRDKKRVRLGHGMKDSGQELTEFKTLCRDDGGVMEVSVK
jgi:hypothetical protein